MNGAESLIRTLIQGGVRVCFANPGTSEMHFVAALDSVEGMRPVLALFEGVATGAADGYGRMMGKTACTLLHLGPGLANGLANLHNARRAGTPVLNIVGAHATHHEKYDAPLQSDIEGLARTVSGWVRTTREGARLVQDVVAAVEATGGPPGQVATLILPADISWSDAPVGAGTISPAARGTVPGDRIDQVVSVLRGGSPTVMLLNGAAVRRRGLMAAARIAAATGVRLIADTFCARLERGAGLPAVERLGYLAEMATEQVRGVRNLVLAGARPPVSFFAYPGRPGDLVPDGCRVLELAESSQDLTSALEALAEAVGAPRDSAVLQQPGRPGRPAGRLDATSIAQAIGALMPEETILVDEGITQSIVVPFTTGGCPPHDLLNLTGGAIGMGLPLSVGAAVACPDRKVICMEGDGSSMYTIAALWTQARERLDIVTIVFANRSYGILNMELQRVGARAIGPKALSTLDLSNPTLDFARLAQAMGVNGTRAETAEAFTAQLEDAVSRPGPHLIEAVIET